MAEFGDLRGPLDKIITELKRNNRLLSCLTCGSSLAPVSATNVDADPATVPAGYTRLIVTKTNGSGTVTITFPDAQTYVLSTNGEVFDIKGSPNLGEFTITGAGGATFKYLAY